VSSPRCDYSSKPLRTRAASFSTESALFRSGPALALSPPSNCSVLFPSKNLSPRPRLHVTFELACQQSTTSEVERHVAVHGPEPSHTVFQLLHSLSDRLSDLAHVAQQPAKLSNRSDDLHEERGEGGAGRVLEPGQRDGPVRSLGRQQRKEEQWDGASNGASFPKPLLRTYQEALLTARERVRQATTDLKVQEERREGVQKELELMAARCDDLERARRVAIQRAEEAEGALVKCDYNRR
jgi:hypothetical protein